MFDTLTFHFQLKQQQVLVVNCHEGLSFVYRLLDCMTRHCVRILYCFQIPIVDDELRKAAGDEKEGKILEYFFRIHVSCSIYFYKIVVKAVVV